MGLFDQAIAILGTIVADIHRHLGGFLILHDEQAVSEVLQVAQGAALAANEAARIVLSLHIQQAAALERAFFHSSIKAEMVQHGFQNGFRFARHSHNQVFFGFLPGGITSTLLSSSGSTLVILVWMMDNTFCTVQ